jgi:prepilin-type N-terminal cleavage/methylation domain-containing protein
MDVILAGQGHMFPNSHSRVPQRSRPSVDSYRPGRFMRSPFLSWSYPVGPLFGAWGASDGDQMRSFCQWRGATRTQVWIWGRQGDHARPRKSISHQYGFTLVEVLIVIVIVAVLAAVVVYAVQDFSGASATANCQSDFKTVEIAREAYDSHTGVYATTVDQLQGDRLKDLPGDINLGSISIETARGRHES